MSNFHFLDIERRDPPVIPIDERRSTFSEINNQYSEHKATTQAKRCLDCGIPYCEWACPVHNYIPNWLEILAKGNIYQAAELCHQTNSLPEICGRICPQDRLCEGACTLNDGFGAVTIGSIEKYITDTAFALGWRPDLSNVVQTTKQVAIVGAGPAGLACADILLRSGIKAVVYDKYPEIGGLLNFGIPPFKLDKQVLELRRQIFEGMGAEFRLGVKIGEDLLLEELVANYDAVFLGMGTYKFVDGQLPGLASDKVLMALPFLIGNINRVRNYNEGTEFVSMEEQQVLVLGGGDTAMDCNRTSIRQGAAKVTCCYRKAEQDMPGSRKEIKHAREEGVKFKFNLQPLRIEEQGEKLQVFFAKTDGDSKDCQEIKYSCDRVIVAFGFRPNPPEWFAANNIMVHEDGRVQVSEHYQTTNPRVFAAGDMVRGADLVVTAIADAREAAQHLVSYLKQEETRQLTPDVLPAALPNIMHRGAVVE